MKEDLQFIAKWNEVKNLVSMSMVSKRVHTCGLEESSRGAGIEILERSRL